MVYNSKLVATVKSNGRFLRDRDGIVQLPFGSEYSLYLKNLNSTRAVVGVSIDGSDVLSGSRIVLNANSHHELMGFMRNGVVDRRFKFIQKTQEIANHRGDRADDGIIRVSFAYEEYHAFYKWEPHPYKDVGMPDIQYKSNSSYAPISVMTTQNWVDCDVKSFVSDTALIQNLASDEGITVPGQDTHIEYGTTYVGNLGGEEVIIIRLQGMVGTQPVREAIPSRQKQQCPTCGRSNRGYNKFCYNCGTNLS